MAACLAQAKKELRNSIRHTLSHVSDAAAAAQTSLATQTLLALPEYEAARTISVYLSMPAGEISTTDIVGDALAQGKRVFIPYTHALSHPRPGQPKSIMDMLQLYSMADLASLEPDGWGIPTPRHDSISARLNCLGGTGITDGGARGSGSSNQDMGLDLIIMPGMAFDADLGRLGHGKGFYDYFLTRCHHASRMPFRIGLSLTEQFLPPTESVPMAASDFRLDALITGDGKLRRAKA